jgi:hypothetical protein
MVSGGLVFLHGLRCSSSSGKDLIFCVTKDAKICARNIQILPDLPAPASDVELGLNHLHIPNPFKKKSSTDFLPSQGSRINLKVSLDEPQDLGQLSFDAPLRGFALCPGGENLFGVVWSEEELMVRISFCRAQEVDIQSTLQVIDCSGAFSVLHQTPAQYVVDVRWLDQCQYAVLFHVSHTLLIQPIQVIDYDSTGSDRYLSSATR